MIKSELDIIPRAKMLLTNLRLALVIVALMLIGGNIVTLRECRIDWIEYASIACVALVCIYIVLMTIITSTKYDLDEYNQSSLVCYVLLIVSSFPIQIMLMCAADFKLYEILGLYIFYEIDKLVFPLATLIFLTITYWLPMYEIKKVLVKTKNIKDIKARYGK